jgi:hypothetical protein
MLPGDLGATIMHIDPPGGPHVGQPGQRDRDAQQADRDA